MFAENIIDVAKGNTYFRKVLYTGKHSQLVVMSIPKHSDIGEETHEDTDQILFFVQGFGEAILNDERRAVSANDIVFVRAGTKHNFVNTADEDLKLITVYAPAEHPDGTIHKTKEDASEEEHA